MYLKSIEIHGFKSFANKIVFQFKDGITGIVGPNGSGKSNVGDAVRWVLGEQSAKQLRGAKMEDVIFAGTQAKKPLGFAYVAITLDNSDHKLPIEYDEVTVARRVYRSGESEYLINGTNCRLRDVQELFLDTGIGKEGYSIIGQGQIDKILSGKPEERRELFDEAAGIVKYKKRQATALKNLEAEKFNLSRINDIISEIENQIEPLEKQSMVAKVFLKYKEELKKYEINQFLMEYQEIDVRRKEVNEKLNIASKDYQQAKDNFEKTKEDYEKLECEIASYNVLLEEEKVSLTANRLSKEKLEGDIKVYKEQINSITQNVHNKNQRLKAIGFDIINKRQEQKRYIDEKATVDEKLDALEKRQAQALNEIRAIQETLGSIQEEIDQCNAEIFDYLNKNTAIKTSQQRYATMLEQNNIKKVELNQKLIKNKSEEAYLDVLIGQFEQEFRLVSNEIQEKTEYNHQIFSCIQEMQDEIVVIDEQFARKQHEYLVEKSRLDSLKNMSERYEGYGQSIRRVMEQKSKIAGIYGVVADIIKVEQQYETAIEIALGGSIQNIVTDNETTAKKLIGFLKKNKFGRATFLPLSNITANRNPVNKGIVNEPGVIGLASELVQAKEQFHQVILHLLGRIVVTRDIDSALALSKKYKNSLRIVTLEGDLINPGGAMSGGAFKNSSNLLSRKRETEELEETVDSFLTQVEILKKEKETKKQERISLKDCLEKSKASLQELYLKQNTAKMNLAQEKAKKEQSNVLYAELTKELQEIDRQMAELRENIRVLEEKLSENDTKSKACDQKIEQLNGQLNESRRKEIEANEQNASLRLELSSLEQSNTYTLENLRRIKKELERLLEEENELSSGVTKEEETLRLRSEQIEDMVGQVATYTKTILALEEKLKEQSEKKEQLATSHRSFLEKREQLSEEMGALDKECYRLSGQSERLEGQYEEIMNYIWQEYELTLHSAQEFKDDSFKDSAFLKRQIVDLKTKIKELGNVNVNAIEDYKKLLERYEFLKTQRDDLIEAEENLMQIIAELDEEMRKQFQEKFKEIRTQFDLVFKELFGGGKGTLELIEGEDILEAGIRITAQPPGKKLQNMMQLSGGEKALTAISLLFAIQNLKPSPFCLLDEIEAALDDSNVNRFAGYLNKLTDHTQFIIITHRRGTMNVANTLYGITMQEKGVSTLVSVNLIENELDK